MSSYYLPPEIWLPIFRIATTCPASQKLYETHYIPFRNPPNEEELEMLGDVRSTKSALVLVCKLWKALAARFFYEDLRICHGLQDLYDSLKRSIGEVGDKGYGAFVRRIELSMIDIDDLDPTTVAINLADILELCPHVEVMLKTDDDLLPHVIGRDSNLESLKRFDWWYPRYRNGVHGIKADYDDPTHGVNFLHEVASRALNLRYLSMGRRSNQAAAYDHHPLSLQFPALTTLRIENLRPYMFEEIQNWEFPCLTHLITDKSLCRAKLSRLGLRVKVLELVNSGGFMEGRRRDNIVYLLTGCPNLLELNFHIEHMYPLPESDTEESPIQCIRLYASLNPTLRWHHGLDKSSMGLPLPSSIWKHYEDHLQVFSTSFPALKRIVLHGDWSPIIHDSRFHLLRAPLIARGCILQYVRDNGVVDTLS